MKSILTLPGFFFLFLSIYTTQTFAQVQAPSLADQYQEIVGRSGSYQGYKQVREARLQALWKSSMDSLQRERQLLREAEARLTSNDDSVSGIRAELETRTKELATAKASKDELSILGISVEKGTYNVFVWSLILLLAGGIAFLTYRSAAARKEAKYRTDLYNELFEEFREYKAKANEKEKKLARELQTERNLIADLRGR